MIVTVTGDQMLYGELKKCITAQLLKEGFEFYGYPYPSNGKDRQAMVKYEEDSDEPL